MAYVELHQEIRNHYKTEALMKRLAISRREAVGIITCLSSWAIGHRPGGIIERNLIHVAVDWEKEPAALLGALIDIGWLDEFDKTKVEIHDWIEVTTGYRRARKDAKRKQSEREEAKKASADTKKLTKDSPKRVRGRSKDKSVRGQSAERRAEQNEQTERTDRTDRPTKSPDPRSSLQQQPQNTPSSGSSRGANSPEGDAGGPVVAVSDRKEGPETAQTTTTVPTERLQKQASIRISTPILEAIGVDGGVAEQLARAYPAVRILHVAEHAKRQENPGGFARKALEQGWTVPDSNGAGLSKLLAALEEEVRGNDEAWRRMGGASGRRAPDFPAKQEGESEADHTARVNEWMKSKKSEGKP